ncbi:MAG: DEAD/DEAH box helicase, partial [Fimbriimonadaceae bacterium]|nr:DEAD/DEAH box helicase [Alphaproteobacteria bacterium]
NAIIFCNRKRDVAIVHRSLVKHGFNAGCLHGDMDQRSRMDMLADFRDGKVALLVASDVAARGLDIPSVSHVINYDVPTHAEDYVHRIGRTGRAGRSGDAITIITRQEKKYLDAILKLTGQEIPVTEFGAGAEQAPKAQQSPAKRPKEKQRKDKIKDEDDNKPRKSAAGKKPKQAKKQSGEEKPSGTPDKSPEKTEKNSNQQPSRHRNTGSAPKGKTVGMGDHTPAFLLRPIGKTKK